MGSHSVDETKKCSHIRRDKTKYTKCVKSSIYKLVNAVTKSVPSSGKSSPTNTESTQLVPTTETAIFNLKELTYTTMKPPVANTSHVPSLSILSPEPWTPSDPVHSVKSSAQTTSSSDNLVPETTGPKVTTQREPNLLTPSSMLSERKPRAAIAFKDSNLHTPSVAVPVQEWEHFLSAKSVKNTQTES